MNEDPVLKLKRNVVAIGRLLWEKELASGLNGNISARLDGREILLTATKTCLGLLQNKDILRMTLDGEVLEEGQVSCEQLLHTAIYEAFPETKAVVHSHTLYTNAYFLERDELTPRIFESKFYLGNVRAVPQTTPSVTDAAPVVEALRRNNIMVLKNHGVVAMGKNLFDCFLLIQCLEEAVKIDAVSRLYRGTGDVERETQDVKRETWNVKCGTEGAPQALSTEKKTYDLFSQEQIDEIVRLVNSDEKLQAMGRQSAMTMELAVCLEETGQVYSFQFDNGRIDRVGSNPQAEFLITAPEPVWRDVFNRKIDPFVATTQKKMNLRGDFARISRWYAPCSRIFELWQQVPVG